MLLRIWFLVMTTMTLLTAQDDLNASQNSHPDFPTENVEEKNRLDDISSDDIDKEREQQKKEEKEVIADELQKSSDEIKSPIVEAEKSKVDTITVKGAVLQGQVVELNSEYLRFKLIYGHGSIRIDYDDIEQLMTEHEYNIFYKGKQTVGKIISIKDHTWLVVQHDDIQETIKIENIDRFLLSTRENDSLINKIHNLFPYSKGYIDIGIEYESGSNVKNKLSVAAHFERKETVNRTFFDLLYNYERTGTVETSRVTNKNEWIISLEQNYYLTKKRFLFAQAGYDYDRPRGITRRTYPALGVGERFEKDLDSWLQIKVGAGAVFEKFVAYGSKQYAAAYFGINGRYTTEIFFLVDRLIFDADLFYMPSFTDRSDDWLARFKGSVSLPIGETLALRFVVRQVLDNNPSPEVGNNKFTMNLYLSFVY